MKKKIYSILCAILFLSASLFGGALAEVDLAGAWDNDEDELSLVFDGDGGVVLSNRTGSIDLFYEWDGDTLLIWSGEDGESLSGTMDDYGDLLFEGMEGYFYLVDEAYYVPDSAWDNDEDELSLVFDGYGGVVLSDKSNTIDLFYAWDGDTLLIWDEEGDEVLSGTMDEDGDLLFEGMEGYFYVVDEAYYAPFILDGSTLPGTQWEMDGIVFSFCLDGAVLMDGEYAGGYFWDGEQYVEMYLEEGTVPLTLDEGLFYEDEDGEYYAFTYLGGVTLLNGAYDNDLEEVSMVFYLDGTFTFYDLYDAIDGIYAMDGEGGLYLETEDGTASGWYDYSDNTFTLDDLDDYFYLVSEPYYTPEVEMIGDPEEP